MPRLKKTPIAILRMAFLCGGVAFASDSPRSKVGQYLEDYHRMEPHQLEEIAHEWLRGFDDAEANRNEQYVPRRETARP